MINTMTLQYMLNEAKSEANQYETQKHNLAKLLSHVVSDFVPPYALEAVYELMDEAYSTPTYTFNSMVEEAVDENWVTYE